MHLISRDLHARLIHAWIMCIEKITPCSFILKPQHQNALRYLFQSPTHDGLILNTSLRQHVHQIVTNIAST
jgi:hypothetical protein